MGARRGLSEERKEDGVVDSVTELPHAHTLLARPYNTTHEGLRSDYDLTLCGVLKSSSGKPA